MSTAGEYLKQAAEAIRRAAVARQQEADEIRRTMEQKDHEKDQRINQLKIQKTALNVQLGNPNMDQLQRAGLLRRVHELDGEEVKVKDAIGREKETLLQLMRIKETEANRLQSQAADFESRWAQG